MTKILHPTETLLPPEDRDILEQRLAALSSLDIDAPAFGMMRRLVKGELEVEYQRWIIKAYVSKQKNGISKSSPT